MIFTADHSIDLAGGGGSGFIDFGNQTWIDQGSWTVLIGTARKATGWYSAPRKLWGRWGSTITVRQALLTVGPSAQGVAARIQLNPANGVVCVRDYAAVLLGKTTYLFVLRFVPGMSLDLDVNGVRVPLIGSVPVPTALKVPVTQSWRVGDTDLLQDLVMHHAVWNVALTDEQMRAVWSRNLIADLRLPQQVAPDGALVDVPAPIGWWPLGTGDVLPDCAPLVGTVHGAVKKANGLPTGSLSATIPKTMVWELTDPDPVAYRFEVASGVEQAIDPRHHNGMPALMLDDDGSLLLAHSKGLHHVTGDQDIVSVRSRDLGQTWPWPNGQAFPGQTEVEHVDYDTSWQGPIHTSDSARGSTLYAIKAGPYAGRVLQFCNYVLYPAPGSPGGLPVGSLERYVDVRHRDAGVWSDWKHTLNIGTQWTSIGGGGRCVEVDTSDGHAVCLGHYARSFVPGVSPPQSQGWYDAFFVGSYDGGDTWQIISQIAFGQSPGPGIQDSQWEEPEVFEVEVDGVVYVACALRRDYNAAPYNNVPSTFVTISGDRGLSWSMLPVHCFEGANWPSMLQLHDADRTILALSRAPLTPWHTQLRYTKPTSFPNGWSDPVDLALPGDSQDVGHSMIELEDGTVVVAQSSEITTYDNAALRFLRLRKIW